MRRALRLFLDLAAVAALTVLTQLGGIAWIAARLSPRPVASFLLVYLALALGRRRWRRPSGAGR
ncbi:MAG: hypothetical protein AAF677_02915 [Pseudomonadota bacterium]